MAGSPDGPGARRGTPRHRRWRFPSGGRGIAISLLAGLLVVPTGFAIGELPKPGLTPTPSAGWSRSSGHSSPGVPAFHLSSVSISGPRPSAGYIPYDAGWLAFVPNDDAFWVAAPPSSVAVVPVSNVTTGYGSYVVANDYGVGRSPFGVGVDPSIGTVLVTNTASDNVTLINATKGTELGSVRVGVAPRGIAVDASRHLAFVANTNSSNVTVLNDSSGQTVANVAVGAGPIGVAYDPTDDRLFVADSTANNVTVISVATLKAIATLHVGGTPTGVAWDNRTDTIYVTNNGTSNISVVNAALDSVSGSIKVGGVVLEGIAYDSGMDQIWAGAGSQYLVEASPGSGSSVSFVGVDPSGVAYDPQDGLLCFTNGLNRTFECLDPTSPLPPAYSPVTVSERGLPTGYTWGVLFTFVTYPWWVYLNHYNSSFRNTTTNTSFIVELPIASFQYDGFEDQSPFASRSGTFNETGSPGSIQLDFSPPPQFDINFTQQGIPVGSGLTWGVDLWDLPGGLNSVQTALASSVIQFIEPNGTYNFTVDGVSGYDNVYGGTVVVAGGATGATVRYTPANTTGNGSTSQYAVWFNESGLPGGTSWGVGFGTTLHRSAGVSIEFNLTNGTYVYGILPVKGYAVAGAGLLVVNGSDQTVAVRFAVPTFPLVVVEFGLPNGTSWNATVSNATTGFSATNHTTGTTLQFRLPNGTYTIRVRAAGYSANLTAVQFTIAGSIVGPVPVAHFSGPSTTGPTPAPTRASSPLLSGLGLIGGGLLVVAAVLALGLTAYAVQRRRWRTEGEEIVATLRGLDDDDPWPAPRK